MGNESVFDNPYQPPQSDLRQTLVAPTTQPLTPKIAARFFIASIIAGAFLFLAHAILGGVLDSRYFVANYGTFSWMRLEMQAAQDGFAYGAIFALSMLGMVWYFCKTRVNLGALWKHYYIMLVSLLLAWLCGGILGVVAHTRGWYEFITDKSALRVKDLLITSPQTAWLICAENIAIICGTICLVVLPLSFALRYRVRDQ